MKFEFHVSAWEAVVPLYEGNTLSDEILLKGDGVNIHLPWRLFGPKTPEDFRSKKFKVTIEEVK